MAGNQSVFNHVGLCVADHDAVTSLLRGAAGVPFWWELDPPEQGTDQLLQLESRSDCTRRTSFATAWCSNFWTIRGVKSTPVPSE